MANGRIEIDIGVDSSEATGELATLDKALDKFGDSLNEMGGDFEQVFDDLDASAAKLSKQTGDSLDKTRGGLEKLSKGAKDTGKELSTGGLKKGTDDSIKGLDSLKGGAGEVSSSFGQFGGAIGVLSPELGGMASQMGALAGGLEGAAKMTKLTGGSMKTLAIGAGALGVVAVSLGVAWKVFSSRLNAANERIKESHIAMEEGIADAKAYKATLMGLQNAVGLLSDEEFARAQAIKLSTEATKQQREEQESIRHVVGELAGDIDGLKEAEAKLVAGEFDHIGKLGTLEIGFRDISKAIKQTSEQLENNEVIQSDNGIAAEFFNSKQIKSGEALRLVRAEIENTQGSYEIYTRQIQSVADKTEKLRLLSEIRSAQTRDDSEGVKKLALSLAILEDVETRLQVAALRAAEALAIQSLQMMNLGPATAASIKGIQKLFDTMELDAPSGFKKTLAQLNTKLKTTAATTKDLNTVEEKAIDLTGRRETALDMLAKATGVQAVADRDYVKAKEEVNKLLEDGALNEKEAALLFKDATAIRVAAFKEGEAEIKAARDAALQQDFEAVQAKIANAQAMNDQISNIISASMDRRSQAIDRDEANALAAAEGNAEKQEQLKAKFDARRQSELGKLFRAQQATEIATTVMSGASAGIGALSMPPTGLGPVAGIPLAILVAATTAAQVGLIASQQPAFHQGGIIGGQGDQAITAQGGEVVLNREAVAAMGGPSAAAGLNQGGGGGGTIVIQNVYKQRVFDAVIADNLAKGGPLKSALNSATRAGRRGRVGGLL